MIIEARIPTIYQLDYLQALGWGFNRSSSGTFSASAEFQDEEEFKEWLEEFKYERFDPYMIEFTILNEIENIN